MNVQAVHCESNQWLACTFVSVWFGTQLLFSQEINRGSFTERVVMESVVKGILTELDTEGSVIVESNGPEETSALGEMLGGMCRPGQIYTLNGGLGTGKTVFTQGFARGLGIAGPVNSPTFTILQIYEGGRMPFYHFDVYRIGNVEEMDEIGYEDCFYGEGVCLIEWAELIREILPEQYVNVTITKDLDKGFDYRKLVIKKHPFGQHS